MKLRPWLTPWRPPALRPAPLAIAPPRALEASRTCGWYDSSHDLRRGLQVHEHGTPDAVAGDLPVAHWVDLHLSSRDVTTRV